MDGLRPFAHNGGWGSESRSMSAPQPKDRMKPLKLRVALWILGAAGCSASGDSTGSWVQRDERWQPRGAWNWAVRDRLPALFAEFNGIDFGHAHLAETLLRTQDPADIEKARLEVVDFIFSGA